ncbi:MAG: peptidase M48, partial [Bacteroidia bacterium]|nr:peptidase M48 [Bacteroidia bacterium]
RVRALKLWHTKPENFEATIQHMIEGDTVMNNLDVFKQQKIYEFTFRIIQLLLKPKWTRTTAVMSLARQYKSDFKNDDNCVITQELVKELETGSASVKEYLCYVLLDFALVDPSLEDVPMGFAFQLAEDLMLKDNFNNVVKKELKLGERKLSELQKRAAKALSEIKESNQEHIYEE